MDDHIAVRVEGAITGVRLDQPGGILVEGSNLAVSKAAFESRDTPDESISDETFFEDPRYLDVRMCWARSEDERARTAAERDAAIARAEAAEGELTLLRCHHCTLNANYDVIIAERDAERERAGRLQEIAVKYGVHLKSCETSAPYTLRPGHGCTCGFADAIDAALALPASDTKEDVS